MAEQDEKRLLSDFLSSTAPLPDHGGPRKQGSRTTLLGRGADYLAARINRDPSRDSRADRSDPSARRTSECRLPHFPPPTSSSPWRLRQQRSSGTRCRAKQHRHQVTPVTALTLPQRYDATGTQLTPTTR